MKKIFGIVGHPVIHSLSPPMYIGAFRAAGIEAEYALFDIDPRDPEELANFCYENELNGVSGFSVTMPYKQAVMAYMDHYDPIAKAVGCVNTVQCEGGMLNGYNTDAAGAIQALKEEMEIPGSRVLVLGAGGASRAVIYALKNYGADVHVWNRDAEKAEKSADEFDVNTIEYRLINKMAGFDCIINATPVGSEPNANESLIHAEQIRPGTVVMDIITCPRVTQLLKEAVKAGARPVEGVRMLLFQAAGQFEIWFGKPAPLEIMEKALYAELEKKINKNLCSHI
jgi:shikimate dehydrogenase